MSDHYYSQQPHSKSSPRTWKYKLRENVFTFTSDMGVFSKDTVDFGSRLLIEKFLEPPLAGDLLDLGCGYGPIGIALATSFPDRTVVLTDVNERALELATINLRTNNVQNAEVVQSNRFDQLAGRKFAAILTNPPIRSGKQNIHAMIEEGKAALLPQGEFWAVIQKKQGAPSYKQKLLDVFNNAETIAKDKGYYIFKAINI
ncbi:class I SAM-dependent methyltransferase [Virgibacillus sp. 179-BFC.A HS]|uniref:Class I SAM-dependent methyltransferase n=1 Tax=Tigheibacillus jepli TaxID=3035914 RepID=A0ABU5CLS4_9BACI|nr:class I SAM-dependent methyltransferase [Virgibacillus sp. 179-BFC.A HS]MDY0407295.1 class I SAM-dependent methyltransferase [Virgibacillus sp. 179-BFC.A HS]